MRKSVVSTVECPKCGAFASSEYWYYTGEKRIDCPECGYSYAKMKDYNFYNEHPDIPQDEVDLDMLEYEDEELVTDAIVYRDNTGIYHASETRKNEYMYKVINRFRDFLTEQIDIFLPDTEYAEYLRQNVEAYIIMPFGFLVFDRTPDFSNIQFEHICDELYEFETSNFLSKSSYLNDLYEKMRNNIPDACVNPNEPPTWMKALSVLSDSENIDEYVIRRFVKFALWAANKRRTTGQLSLAARYMTKEMKTYMQSKVVMKAWLYSDKHKPKALRMIASMACKNIDYAAGRSDEYDDISFAVHDLKTV